MALLPILLEMPLKLKYQVVISSIERGSMLQYGGIVVPLDRYRDIGSFVLTVNGWFAAEPSFTYHLEHIILDILSCIQNGTDAFLE